MNPHLERYCLEVKDLGASGPEHLQMLHRRDELAESETTLSPQEQASLAEADRLLLQHATALVVELSLCIDLAKQRREQNIPPSRWWWYLDVISHLPLEAKDARECLEVLDREVVDLILLDIHMPGPRGNQLLKFLRERRQILTPVIVLSGYLQKDVVHEVSGLSVSGVLAKPIRVKRLTEEIHKALTAGTPE